MQKSMIEIINVINYERGIEAAVKYIHSKWGSPANYPFYYDAISHSSLSDKPLPRFYLLLKNNQIIGCYGLIVNDFISRHDLYPWFVSLFIEENERGHNYGKLLLEHAESETKKIGFTTLYLTTDHDGYYEKYGWERMENGYELNGNQARIYKKEITVN